MAVGNHYNERAAFGLMVRKIRLEAGLSLRQLAARCCIDHADIARIERAIIRPRIDTIIELGKALEVPVEILFMTDPQKISKYLSK